MLPTLLRFVLHGNNWAFEMDTLFCDYGILLELDYNYANYIVVSGGSGEGQLWTKFPEL